ncbi:hypothetical protein OAP74_01080 [bacterium]|nr:hypothetical protein [bacterium]
MSYTINLTDGTIFAVVADGTINTDSSQVLVGKNYAGYGEFLDENFIRLLENAANTSAPGAPLTGQLWYDKTNNVMKVYNGTTFKVISAATASTSQPTSNIAGDLWFDTTNDQLKVYNGSTFITIGPSFTSGEGTSGAIVTTITDNVASDHVVVQMYVNNVIVSIFSKDATFTPAVAISGFATIGPGLNMSTTVSNAVFNGTATNADTLDTLNSTSFMRSDAATSNNTSISVLSDTGLFVGADSDAKISVSGTDVTIANQTSDGDTILTVNDGGVTTTVIQLDGATATVGVRDITNLQADGVGNIGTASVGFNTVHAKATSAQYADMAERFHADAEYAPGTIVELGGVNEVTLCVEELSSKVFGVVSTQPAYLMNGNAGSNATHPPIAMSGRVPVNVMGFVTKGDRLVSAGNGTARAANLDEITSFNVIGRALESKTDEGIGSIEAIVKIV